mmetsp:Transcript_12923/g.54201  ORF Transcript_12923/g.54201 Transcript_12923/m.54201 type:complete len:329 (-) Transcript_12923:132-1118(-)
MAAADQARAQAHEERRERERSLDELEMIREALAMESTRRANAERIAAAAEHAAATAAEDAEYARELLEQAGAKTPARASPLPEYGAPHGVQNAAAETLNAAAEAAELLDELKGGMRVSVEHQRALQDLRARAYGNSANIGSPRGGVSPRAYAPQRKMAANSARDLGGQSAHARGMAYGRQVAGRAPNVGYANRAETTARERLESSHYAQGGQMLTGMPGTHGMGPPPYRPQDRLKSPYLDPNSASARSRRASVNAGHQWATPALQRAKRHVATRGGEAEVESFPPNNVAAERWNSAVEYARKEYVADKRAAAERRRARMANEESMPMA